MALVNIEQIVKKALQSLSKLEPPQGVELLSYKRNRGVFLLLEPNHTVVVRERGYLEEESAVPLAELEKLLKTIVKREFPRSRKVRMYQLAGPEDLDQERKKL